MTLRTTEPDSDVVEFVRLGQRVSLDYRVRLEDWATFQATMAVVEGGNNFDPTEVAETIGTIFDDVMAVEFGAEGSAVLYVILPFWSSQRLTTESVGMGEKYSVEQRQELAQRVIDWARSVQADEICTYQHPVTDEPVRGKPGDHPYRIRIWWD